MISTRGLCQAVVLVIVALSLLSTSAVCAEDAHSPDTLLQKKLLSAEEATFIAVLPGFLFHGLGNFYAHNPKTGIVLLVTEGVGVYFFGVALAKGLSDNSFAKNNADLDSVIGSFAFLGSWFYDMATAGAAAQRHNRRISLGISKSKTEGEMIYVRLHF